MIRLLVTGGRYFADVFAVHDTLSHIHAEYGIAAIIQGGATGADELARIWADDRDIPVETYAADWKLHGKAAGPIRNARMVAESKPDIVVAFRGGRGTADCVSQAVKAGVQRWQW